MSTLTISDIDESLEARLRSRAEANGHTVEEEVRDILQAVLPEPARLIDPEMNLADAIHSLFAPLGGVDLDLDWLRKQPNTRKLPTFD